MFQIITFYEFKPLKDLEQLKSKLLKVMDKYDVFGTILLAEEGYNSTVCGQIDVIDAFVEEVNSILCTSLKYKSSFHKDIVFKRQKVRLKHEIVALKKKVNIDSGKGTHVSSERWNELINDPDTYILDARNDYEVQLGTFKNATNPQTDSFHELPAFVRKNMDPKRHKRVAMFCTGGIRCEKFAPYLKEQGFDEVFQLKGGILKYLEEIPNDESQWSGECFVFDERISVDEHLEKGEAADPSLKSSQAKKKITGQDDSGF